MTTNTTLNMGVTLAGMNLRNPVMTASGTFGYGEEFSEYVDLTKLGAYVTKGLSLRPRPGLSCRLHWPCRRRRNWRQPPW